MLKSVIRVLLDCSPLHMVPAGGEAGTAITADEALQGEEARYAAQLANDFAAMERLFGDDLVYIHSNTLLDTKRSFIESMRSGAVKYREMKRGEVKVRTFGSVAVITGQCKFEVTSRGEDRSLDLFFHSVWAKRPAGVQFISWQSTRVPPKA